MTKRCRYEARGLVTVTAIAVGRHMVRWRRFASGGNTIMARGAVIHDTCVIIAGTDKGSRVVTNGAILTIRWKMGRCQAGRGNTIVARCTVISNTGMFKYRWYKGAASYVADVTVFSGRHMRWICLGIFARCIDTIVTEITPVACDFWSIMVDKCIEEISCVMAYDTISIRVAMNDCICRASGTCQHIICASIMAGGTVIADARVSKNRWEEYSDRMADVTILGRR